MMLTKKSCRLEGHHESLKFSDDNLTTAQSVIVRQQKPHQVSTCTPSFHPSAVAKIHQKPFSNDACHFFIARKRIDLLI